MKYFWNLSGRRHGNSTCYSYLFCLCSPFFFVDLHWAMEDVRGIHRETVAFVTYGGKITIFLSSLYPGWFFFIEITSKILKGEVCHIIIEVFLFRYGLAVMHSWVVFGPISKIWIVVLTYVKYLNLSEDNLSRHLWCLANTLISYVILHISLPIFVFMALYGKTLFDLSEKQIQTFIAASIILTSRRFMLSIAKFPLIGGKVYMINKVFMFLDHMSLIYDY